MSSHDHDHHQHHPPHQDGSEAPVATDSATVFPAESHVTNTHNAHGGAHDKHAGHSVAMFRDRFWLSLILTLPVVAFSEMVQEWFGYTVPSFPGSDWVAPVLGTAIFLYGGSPFLRGAVGEVRSRQPGMMLLIGMAITVAFAASLATTLGWFELDFWWELAALITIMLLGHWLEMRAIGQAQGALAALAALLPDEAERVTDSGTETVAVSELKVNDLLLVRPGGRVPADGVIVEGEAEVDESMVTGESKPVAKAPGRSGGGGDRGDRLFDQDEGGSRGRGDRPGRYSTSGRPGAAIPLAGSGTGGPGSRPAVLCGDCRRGGHGGGLAGRRPAR